LRGWKVKADGNDLTVHQDLRLASLKLSQGFRAFLFGLLAPDFDGRDAVVVVQILGRSVHLEHTAREEDCRALHLFGGDHAEAMQVGFLVEFVLQLCLIKVAADDPHGRQV
jgi:hypothetical protein